MRDACSAMQEALCCRRFCISHCRGTTLAYSTNMESIESVWARIQNNIEITDVCWLWRGAKNSAGYGVISARKLGFSSPFFVHRLSVWVHTGVYPGPHPVLHSCHNPACCNPAHLRIGTYSENSHDMNLAGRNSMRKLTAGQVAEIREIHALRLTSATPNSIAKAFRVSRNTIRKIVSWQSYRDIID